MRYILFEKLFEVKFMDYKKIGLLLAVGVVILIAMIYIVGPEQIIEALKTADIRYVLLAVIVQFIIIGLWNTRWSLICKSLDIPHTKMSLFTMTIVGLAVNNLTPSGRSGGEPVRAYILSKKSGRPFKTTFATVMGDKIFDTLPFMVLAIFSITYLMINLHLSTTIFAILMAALILFVILLAFIIYICINETFGIKTIKWVFRQVRRFTKKDVDEQEQSAKSSLIGFQSNLKYILADKKILIYATIISFTVWFLELLRVYIVFQAFGVHVAIGMIASVFLVSALVGVIPALPGGLGSIDGLMILFYSMAGIASNISTAATLVERMISLWMIIVMGVILLPFFGTGVLDKAEEQKSKEDAKKEAEQDAKKQVEKEVEEEVEEEAEEEVEEEATEVIKE